MFIMYNNLLNIDDGFCDLCFEVCADCPGTRPLHVSCFILERPTWTIQARRQAIDWGIRPQRNARCGFNVQDDVVRKLWWIVNVGVFWGFWLHTYRSWYQISIFSINPPQRGKSLVWGRI